LQERVVDEVKQALRPFYSHKKITKEQYKEILRKAVPKVILYLLCFSPTLHQFPTYHTGAAIIRLLHGDLFALDKLNDQLININGDLFFKRTNRCYCCLKCSHH
jgi:hypothetical protein